MPKIISLGLGAYVDAEQIVAVDDAHADDELRYNLYTLGFGDLAKSTILLKDGVTIPGYVKPETIRKRWKEAFELPDFLLKRINKALDALDALEERIEQNKLVEVPKAIMTMPTGTTVEDLKKCTSIL